MKLKFLYQINDGIKVSDYGNGQYVIGCILDGTDIIVLLVDENTKKFYIEKVDNKFLEFIFFSHNFLRISDDDKWNAYLNFFRLHGAAI